MSAVAEQDRPIAAPILDIDPYAIEVLDNPYPFHQQLREAGPVAMIRPHQVYAVGRFAEASVVLNDHARFTAAAGIGIQDIRKPGEFRVPNRLLENDPPNHTKMRGVLSRLLSPIVIRGWRDHFEAEARKVAAEVVARGEFDGVEHVAEEYVLRVFPNALGVKIPRREILAIGAMRFNQSGPQNELYRLAMERAQPYLEWFENSARRESVTPGSISDALFVCEEKGELDEGVASNMVRTFVGGGTDSTITGIGHTLNLLAQNPDQFAILKADPSKVKAAFEEGLRMETPFQVTYRTTTGATELGGVALEADSKVGVFLGAANRDPRKWRDPDQFDVLRDVTGLHVGFGVGAHICIGQMIARLEAEAILKAIVAAVDRLEPAGPPRYRPINQMRQLDALPLRAVRA
jgi:cytochrome P450